MLILPLKCQAKFVADNILNFSFIIIYFSEKISLDISCESSAWLMIHMKCQDFILWEKNKKKYFFFFYWSCDWLFKG